MAGRRKKPTFKKEWTPEDEVALFNAIAKYKPVGMFALHMTWCIDHSYAVT